MDHLPVDIHSQLLTKSIADPRWMAPEKTSSGQYKEELTPCNLSSSACFNGWGCHLASGTMDVPSINWWIRFSRAFCTVLYMWMMSSYTALTLFLILNMCEVFLIFSASINSASTLINAWLQLLQLNNSVWKYQDQVAFHYSNTHTDHLHLSPVLPTRKVYSISWEFWEFLQNVIKGDAGLLQQKEAGSWTPLHSTPRSYLPRNQILRLQLWDVCSLLLSLQISVSC